MWDVDPGLPADRAGMKAGDRLVAVAGESVDGLGHEETVCRIRAQGSCVSLIVVDPEADRFFSMVCDRVGERAGMKQGSGATGFLPSLTPRYASLPSSSWRTLRLLPLLWQRPRIFQLKIQLSLLALLAPANASCTRGLEVVMDSDSAVWPVGRVFSSPR